MNADDHLRILIVEDLPSDAELAERELRNDGILFTSVRVETKEGFLEALEEFWPDLIISDYAMPEFSGIEALQLSLAHDPYLPFILLTGSMNEETAVTCMKAGATDYIIKERMKRLPSAVRGALEQRKIRLQREEDHEELIAIHENAPLVMMLMDGERRLHKVNGFAAAFSDRSAEAMILMRCGEALRCVNALAAPEGCGFAEQCEQCIIHRSVTKTLGTGQNIHHAEGSLSYRSERREGTMMFLLSTTKLHFRRQPLVLMTLLDITERKQSEEALRLSEENFRRSLDDSPLGVRIVSEEGENLHVNRALLDIFGYENMEEFGKTPITKRYTESSYAEVQERQDGRHLDGDDSSKYEIDIEKKDGTVHHLQVWRKRVLWNRNEHYQVIYRDITDSKRAEKVLRETLESLRKAVGTTIQVIVSAVETRDPYTAGHQLRTADLARAIATEMGLPEEKIDGIRIAGSIHDLGKLSIPAEILSKPDKLSEIEFSLITEHAQRGYMILRDVESTSPLAEIVYQHHERMDGSGYPRHLKKDDILLEARIMAVADVVEAMASHRPYRPALGIPVALEEIEKNRGILYDNTVADACLRLFREKGFQFTGS